MSFTGIQRLRINSSSPRGSHALLSHARLTLGPAFGTQGHRPAGVFGAPAQPVGFASLGCALAEGVTDPLVHFIEQGAGGVFGSRHALNQADALLEFSFGVTSE